MKKFLIILTIIVSAIMFLFVSAIIIDNVFNIGLTQYTIELNKAEKECKRKFEELFEKDFKDYEIKYVEQITDTQGFGAMITDIAKCEVEIGKEKYLFFYDNSTDEYFSNFYYEQILNEIKEYYSNTSASKLPSEGMQILLSNSCLYVDDKALFYNDRSFEDILSRNKVEEYPIYDISINCYIKNSVNFCPENYKIEELLEENPNVQITVLKTDKGYKQSNHNELYLQESYEFSLQENRDVIIYKKINKKIQHNNIWFIYDGNCLDVEISTLTDTDIAKHDSKKIIKEAPINYGFNLKATKKDDLIKKEYTNCLNTTTEILSTENTIQILMDKKTYEGKYMIDGELNKYLMDSSDKNEKFLYDFIQVYDEPVEKTYVFYSGR